MNRRGHCGRVDGNHGDIIKALRDAGIKAVSTAQVGDGFPDICASFRGGNFLLEVKDPTQPPNKQLLNAAELKFHETWPGQVAVVKSPEEAVAAVVEAARRLDLI